jgi:mannitol operon transcriptional antiterminator
MTRMMSLTTAQRDLLQQLLAAEAPVSAATLGLRLRLTPRQVQYGLREVKAWLDEHQATLRHSPGLGAQVVCTSAQRQRLQAELAAQARFQLILTPGQRQQLLALQLLAAGAPFILSQLQDAFAVARATVLKDLDAVGPWLGRFQLAIGRRQHRGFWVDGAELARRQALAALLWGDVPFEHPLMAVDEGPEIAFGLAQDAALLPAVAQVNALLDGWDLVAAQRLVIQAEAELHAHFSAVAVRLLTLEIAIQIQRVAMGQPIALDAAGLAWAREQPTWGIAAGLAARLWPALPPPAQQAEAAALAIQLITQERDEPRQNDLVDAAPARELIGALQGAIAGAFGLPDLAHDQLLRDGLAALVLPACVRQRFGLWTPPHAVADIQGERYARERQVAERLAAQVAAATGLQLPPDAQNNLVLLLRAAVVRARPVRSRRVLVVCPSGMATTQLLVARLRARFPRLGSFEVLPIRALSPERVAGADLIIATVPLALPDDTAIDVIQVHPMLQPEDIVALTNWMA